VFDCVTYCNVTVRHTWSPRLTDLQQAILDVIWTEGPSSAERIREALRTRHPLKDSSVRTMLRRLEARGYLRHRTEGKAFVYTAKLAPKGLAARTVRHVIERFCAGSVEQFLVGLVDEHVVPLEELQRLMRQVKRRHDRGLQRRTQGERKQS
jgi:BlaI family penicillinase repressor